MTSACKPVITGFCSGVVNAQYAYDPLGRRTHKSGTGVNERYVLIDGDDDVLEYDGGKNVLAYYVPGPAIDEPIAQVKPNGSGGYAHEYFHTNHQGSIIAMSDDTAALTEGPFLYDPYGNCFKGSTACASLTGSIPYKFTGRRLDEETGFYYYRARCYIPALGRFCQTDPAGYTAGMNLYAYVDNNPINETDPSGNCDDVNGCGEAAVRSQQILNSPAGQEGQLLGIVTGIIAGGALLGGVEIGGAILAGEAEMGAGAASIGGGVGLREASAELRVGTAAERTAARAEKTETHHVVPKADRRAAEARDNMRANGINPRTDKANQVRISGDKHDITKRESYVRDTNSRVANQSGASAIRQECCNIGNELKDSSVEELDKRYPPK